MAGRYNLITNLLLNTGDYQKGLNKISKETQQFANGIEKVGNGVKMLGGIAAGFLAVGSATAVASKLINATAASAGEFEKKIITAKVVTDEFFRLINIGDFSNLIQGLKNAAEVGREYAEILDLIEDRKRSSLMLEAKENLEISQLYEIYNNKTNSKDVRLEALNKIVKKEKELGDIKLKIAGEEYKANLSLMLNKKEWTQQEQQDLENLLLTFNSSDKLREEAIKYNEYKENASYTGSGGYGSAEAVNIMRKKANDYLKTITAEQAQLLEKYYKIFLVYDLKSDENIDNWVNSYKNLYDVQTQVQNNQNTIIKKSSSLELGVGINDEKLEKILDNEQKQEEAIKRKWYYQEQYNKSIERLSKLVGDNPIYKNNTTIKVDKNSQGASKGYGQKTELLNIELDELITRAEQQLIEFNERVGEIFENGLISSLTDVFTAIGENIAGGDKVDWSNLILGNLSTVLSQLGQMAIAAGVATIGIKKAFESMNGYAAIAAGVALVALAAGTKYYMNQQAEKMGGYANGGIIGGYSYSGDNILARVNSGEMVLNQSQQSKLFAIANGAGVGGGSVEFEIRGDKLVGVLNNYNKKYNTWR